MKQVINNTKSQKLILQKKTIQKLSTANMLQIQGGVRKPNNSTTPISKVGTTS
jgi:hypothetical protein